MYTAGPGSRRAGVVGAWVVVALVALVGIAALVMDLGRMMVAAQHTQNVADGSSLAGALQLPDRAACTERLQGLVLTTNLDNPRTLVSVDPAQDLVFYEDGDRVPDFGLLIYHEWAVAATGHTVVPYLFGRIFGFTEQAIQRAATAYATDNPGPEHIAIFAGATGPREVGVTASGSDLQVAGGMHSNSQVTMTGQDMVVAGVVEYRHRYRITDVADLRGELRTGQVDPYPVDFTWEQFDQGPWDHEYSGDLSTTELPSGRIRVDGDLTLQGNGFYARDSLWVVTGDVQILGSGAILDRVTIVAQGTIRANGASGGYSPYVENLFLMSLSNANPAIRFNGADTQTNGIIFAPNGQVEYNGGSQEVHDGAIIGLTVDINGGGSVFRALDATNNTGPSRVRLIR